MVMLRTVIDMPMHGMALTDCMGMQKVTTPVAAVQKV